MISAKLACIAGEQIERLVRVDHFAKLCGLFAPVAATITFDDNVSDSDRFVNARYLCASYQPDFYFYWSGPGATPVPLQFGCYDAVRYHLITYLVSYSSGNQYRYFLNYHSELNFTFYRL